ncbi:PQQ-like domain-containing protein [Rhizobacter sp. OV335]|nr:PQQ-like domain-containing protein [Rhizobacter sp. OV335]
MIARGLWVACVGAIVLAGCGGGGGDSNAPAAPQPPQELSVSRSVVAGTSVHPVVTLDATALGLSDTLYATVNDPGGVFGAPVAVTASGGSYALELATLNTATTGTHAGQAVVNLCRDAACSALHSTPTMVLNYSVDVLAADGAWPGNHLTTLAAMPGAPEWSTFQGNAAHTGHVPVTLDPNRFSTRWQVVVPSHLYFNGLFNLATVTTEGGRFFIAGNNAVTARSEHDGSVLWSYSFSGLEYPSVNPPAVRDGTVYVSAGQQSSATMFGLDASDGSVRFRSDMSNQWSNYLAPTVGPSGVYANAGTTGGMYAFDLQGTPLYFSPTDFQSTWTPAVDSSAVYAYSGDALRVFHPTTGALQATIADPTFTNYIYEIGGSAVLGGPDSVFAAAYANSFLNSGTIGNSLLHFNLQANTIDWSIQGVYPRTPAYGGGVLYAVNNNPLRLEARAESDGALLWSWTPQASSDTSFVSEVLLTDNAVIVSTNRSTYAIDRTTHRAAWSYPAPGNLALSRNGVLYIAGYNTVGATSMTLTAINLR